MPTLKQLFARFVPRRPPRVILDTNVLVSGTIVRQGFPSRILLAALDQSIILVVSPYLLAEYLSVIQRPHIAKSIPTLTTGSVLSAALSLQMLFW